jgi:hypothetical protein
VVSRRRTEVKLEPEMPHSIPNKSASENNYPENVKRIPRLAGSGPEEKKL